MFYDTEKEMLFGSSVKIHDSVVELKDFNTGKSIFVKKAEIDYVKTPNGYITFNPKIRKVALSVNRTVRVILLGSTGILGRYNYLGDGYNDQFNGAGSFEIDYNPLTVSRKLNSLDLRFGFGTEYQIPREIKNINGKISFFSFFGVAKICFMNDEDVSPGIYSRYGMNSFRGTNDFPDNKQLSGSSYLSAGLYLSYKHKYELRGAYTVNNGFINNNQIIKYQTFDIILGVVIR